MDSSMSAFPNSEDEDKKKYHFKAKQRHHARQEHHGFRKVTPQMLTLGRDATDALPTTLVDCSDDDFVDFSKAPVRTRKHSAALSSSSRSWWQQFGILKSGNNEGNQYRIDNFDNEPTNDDNDQQYATFDEGGSSSATSGVAREEKRHRLVTPTDYAVIQDGSAPRQLLPPSSQSEEERPPTMLNRWKTVLTKKTSTAEIENTHEAFAVEPHSELASDEIDGIWQYHDLEGGVVSLKGVKLRKGSVLDHKRNSRALPERSNLEYHGDAFLTPPALDCYNVKYQQLNHEVGPLDDDLCLIESVEGYHYRMASQRGSILRADTVVMSSLFYQVQGTGRTIMRLPKDQVRLLMDPDLEAGNLSVEQWRKDDNEKATQLSREVNNLCLSCKKDVSANGHVGGLPPLRYVLTVDDDLYRKIFSELNDRMTEPLCGTSHCCLEDEKVDYRVAAAILCGVLLLLFITSTRWLTE